MNDTLSMGAGKDHLLTAQEFIKLSQLNGWGKGRTYGLSKVEKALGNTFFLATIRAHDGELIGCARALSDDLFFTTIPDIFIHPHYQGKGLGTQLMETIKTRLGHTAIFLGAQPGKEAFYEKLGFEKGLQSYVGKF